MADENGKRPIDRVVSAWNSNRQKVVVDEWGGLELWFGRLTQDDVEAVEAQLKQRYQDGEWSRHERNLRMLIHKAELEDGTQAFSTGDYQTLKRKTDFITLVKLTAAMWGEALSPEDVKKKSAKTGSSDSSSGSPATSASTSTK